MRIILASQSPRRKELMEAITKDFEIIVSNADEKLEEGLTIEEQAKNVSYQKAKAVFDMTEGNRVIIGSDTMVVKNNKIYGKPKTKEEAKEMVNMLKNTKHTVYTGLAILEEKNGEYKEILDCDTTEVYFGDMTEKEIEDWVNSGEAMDKAGAYAVQGKFMVFIDKIEGNYQTVMGLPIHKVYEHLKKLGAIEN